MKFKTKFVVGALLWCILIVTPVCAQESISLGTLKSLYQDQQYDQLIQKGREFLNITLNQKQREWALFFLGESYYYQKNYELAVETLSQIIEAYPRSELLPKVHFVIALCYNEKGYPINAIGHLRYVVKSFETHPIYHDALYLLAENLYGIKDYLNAVIAYQKYLNITEDGLDISIKARRYKSYYYAGLSYFHLGHFEKSIEQMDQIIEIKGDLDIARDISAKLVKAKSFAELNRFDEALSLLEEIVLQSENKEWSKNALWEQIGLSANIKNYAYSREKIDQYLEQYGKDDRSKHYQLYYFLGLGYFFDKTFDLCIEAFKKASQFARDDQEVLTCKRYIGLSYYNQGLYKKSATIFEEVIVLFPKKSARVHYYLGWSYMRLGKENKALEQFIYFEENFSGDILVPDVLFWISDYYGLKNNNDLQAMYLQKIITNYRTSDLVADVYYQLAIMELQENRQNKALDYLEKIDPLHQIYYESLLVKLEIYMNQGLFLKVIEILEPLVGNDQVIILKQNIDYLLGNAYVGLKDWVKAEEFFKQSMYGHEGPIVMESMLALAYALYHQGLWTESLNMFIKVERRMSRFKSEEIYFKAKLGTARCFENLNQLDAAKTVYKEVIALNHLRYKSIAQEMLGLLAVKRKMREKNVIKL